MCSVPWPLNRSEVGGDLVSFDPSWFPHVHDPVWAFNMRITRFAHEKKEEGHFQPYFYSMARAPSTELKNEQRKPQKASFPFTSVKSYESISYYMASVKQVCFVPIKE